MRLGAAALGVLCALLALCTLVGWLTMIRMPGSSFPGPLPALTAAQTALGEELRRDVTHLAADIGERNLFHHGALERAAEWIEAQLTHAGYTPQRQTFQVDGQPCHNIEVQIEGNDHHNEVVVIGAHYDSAPGTPGANDNASGTAALLALARRLRETPHARTLRLVWFTNEEPPHFQTPNMGSLRYARRAVERRERIVAMLSLETIGYYSTAQGSQQYPAAIGWLYPSVGDFIGFVADLGSRDLVRRALGAFRRHAPFPSQGAALPRMLPGVGWSDHWAFWQHGYPAVMVTDTAPFRYPHYHQRTDTPDKLDYARLARVVDGLRATIAELVQR